MKRQTALVTGIVAVTLALAGTSPAHSQQRKPSAAIVPAEKLSEGWEEIDQRLIFLMVRLANVEASLDAVEKAIGSGTRKRVAKTGEAKRAEAGNDRMDRKGGGPMKWSEFYGTTAESFFYHPTDRNSTYHTTTILNQRGPEADNKVGGGVPAGQGVPAHQRPPQFDYIYRANEKAKERAEEEVIELKGKIEELAERRHRLETEQAGLWCEVAFRAVSHYDLDKKPLYRFEPIIGSDTESRQNAESMKAAAVFMALALSIVDEAQKDQATTFSKIKPAVSEARQRLNDGWLELGIDTTDRYTTVGKFAALAKHLDDVASNLSDSYVVANEGEQAKDQLRKDTFRAMLQESLVSYAQIILALDEMSTVMKDDWKVKPDVKKPIQFVSLADVRASVAIIPSAPPVIDLSQPKSIQPKASDALPSQPRSKFAKSSDASPLLQNGKLDGWQLRSPADQMNWVIRKGVLTNIAPGPSLVTRAQFKNFDLHLEVALPTGGNSGVFLRGRYEVQLLDDAAYRFPDGTPIAADHENGAIYGLIAPTQRVYSGADKWTSVDVRLIDRTVTVRLNNVTVIDGKPISRVTPEALDDNEAEPGPIMLQDHKQPGSRFRNITIKPLP